MRVPILPPDESGRLAALRAYHVLDTPPEADFDDLTALAAHVCGAPIALITLIDAERQSLKSMFGVSLGETPRGVDIAGRELPLEVGQNFIQNPSSPEQLLRTVRRCLDS